MFPVPFGEDSDEPEPLEPQHCLLVMKKVAVRRLSGMILILIVSNAFFPKELCK